MLFKYLQHAMKRGPQVERSRKRLALIEQSCQLPYLACLVCHLQSCAVVPTKTVSCSCLFDIIVCRQLKGPSTDFGTNELFKLDHRIRHRAYQRINYIYEQGFYKKVIDSMIGRVLYHDRLDKDLLNVY